MKNKRKGQFVYPCAEVLRPSSAYMKENKRKGRVTLPLFATTTPNGCHY